jgi:Sensors of blue-light using FAD
MVRQLLYISSAKRTLLRVDIESILFSARRYNARDEITGMLIASSTRFIQVLEGEPDKVQQTFDRIRLDDRHYAEVILRETMTSERQFAQWSMASQFLDEGSFGIVLDQARDSVSNCDVITRAYLLGFLEQNLAA